MSCLIFDWLRMVCAQVEYYIRHAGLGTDLEMPTHKGGVVLAGRKLSILALAWWFSFEVGCNGFMRWSELHSS